MFPKPSIQIDVSLLIISASYKVYEPSLICTVYSVCLQYMKAMKVTLTTPTPLIPKVFLHRKALVKKNVSFTLRQIRINGNLNPRGIQ